MELVPTGRHQQRQQQTQQAQPRQDVENRVELKPGADQEAPQERTGDTAETAEPGAPGHPRTAHVCPVVVRDEP